MRMNDVVKLQAVCSVVYISLALFSTFAPCLHDIMSFSNNCVILPKMSRHIPAVRRRRFDLLESVHLAFSAKLM